MLPEHSYAVLTVDLPEHRLTAGDIGVIVHIHGGGKAYEVEFCRLDGVGIDVVTLEARQVRAGLPDEIVHARKRGE